MVVVFQSTRRKSSDQFNHRCFREGNESEPTMTSHHGGSSRCTKEWAEARGTAACSRPRDSTVSGRSGREFTSTRFPNLGSFLFLFFFFVCLFKVIATGTKTQAEKYFRRIVEWQWQSQPWIISLNLVFCPNPPDVRLFQAVFPLAHYVMPAKRRSQMEDQSRSRGRKTWAVLT